MVSKNSVKSGNTDSKKSIVVLVGVIVVLVVIIAVVLSVFFGSPKRKMQSALGKQNAYDVNVLYSQAYGDSKLLAKYDNAISDFLDKACDKLNKTEYSEDEIIGSGSAVVFRDLQNNYGDLIYSETGDAIEPSISYYNQMKWDKLNNIINSKISYCNGVQNRNDSPQEAIYYFRDVIPEDSYYEKIDDELVKCVDSYINQTLSDVEELISNDDISAAISKIESVNSFLENEGLNSDTIKAKLKEIKDKYAATYAAKAAECFNNKDVDGAIGNIDVAVELSPDNSEYKSKKDTYEMYMPFYLYLEENYLSIEDNKDFWGLIGFDSTCKSNDNKDMTHCISWYNNNSDATQAKTVNYVLSGKYDVVTGTIFLPSNDSNTEFSGYFEVYGDGTLIYTSPKVTKNVLPQDIEFSVTGVQKLAIKFYGQGTGGFLSTSPDFCVSNLTAQKNFS